MGLRINNLVLFFFKLVQGDLFDLHEIGYPLPRDAPNKSNFYLLSKHHKTWFSNEKTLVSKETQQI